MKNDLLKLEIQLFGASNSTTNYHLSQYIGTDKPTYLGDYNSDMSKIDTAIKSNETASTNNASDITTINTNIGTMSNLKTTASNLVGGINENYDNIGDMTNLSTPNTNDLVSAVNSVNTNVGDVTTLKTDSKTSTVSAINEIYDLFDFTATSIASSDLTPSTGVSNLSATLTLATNTDNSMFKLYGSLDCVNNTGNGTVKFQSSLRPSSDITFTGLFKILKLNGFNTTPNRIYETSFSLSTSGEITINCGGASSPGTYVSIFLPACIYIVKDFGDQPII